MEKDLICRFNEVLSQLRALHWQTESYARHIAYERTYNTLSELFDSFIESYQGKYKRIRITCQPTLLNINDDINGFIDENINFLTNDLAKILSEEDTDLLNIRDEIISAFNTLKYLLTLK